MIEDAKRLHFSVNHPDDPGIRAWGEFGRTLTAYAGWGMRIEFVPDDQLHLGASARKLGEDQGAAFLALQGLELSEQKTVITPITKASPFWGTPCASLGTNS